MEKGEMTEKQDKEIVDILSELLIAIEMRDESAIQRAQDKITVLKVNHATEDSPCTKCKYLNYTANPNRKCDTCYEMGRYENFHHKEK